jgi:hypothetical protein
MKKRGSTRTGIAHRAFHETEMTSQAPRDDEERGRILPFTPRVPRARNDNARPRETRNPLIDDIEKYARIGEEDNYRHRMLTNLLAFLVLCFIVYCGVWLANTMAQLRKDQDCVLTGRTNCAPIRGLSEPR